MNYNLNQLVKIVSTTPSDYDHSVGFHDIRPFNKLNNKQKQILGYCSIPPKSENDRINIKCGYEVLK